MPINTGNIAIVPDLTGITDMDVVGGRLDLVSATSLKWGFQDNNQIRLWDGVSSWKTVKCANEPTLANTATDLNGTALAVNQIYDVFAEYSSATAFSLVTSRWGQVPVNLLLHMEGVNNSTTFTDSSIVGNTLTAVGDAKISTTQYKFGSSSAYFDGSGDKISIADNSVFALGSGDFTIDFWFYASNVSGLKGLFSGATGFWLGVGLWNNHVGYFAGSNGTSWNIISADSDAVNGVGSNTVTANAWHHLAFVREGNMWYGFLDGVRDLSVSSTAAVVSRSEGKVLGFWDTYGYPYAGYIDEFRFIKGLALWNSNFTPPTSAGGVTVTSLSYRALPYSSTITYAIGDRVIYGGKAYACIQAGTNKTPSSETAYWVDNGSLGGDGATNNNTGYATPAIGNNSASPYTISCTSYYTSSDSYNAWLAFNQNDGSNDGVGSWISNESNGAPSTGTPQTLMVDFGRSVCINKYILKARYASTQNYRAFPKTWTLEGSNTGALGDAAGDINGTNGWFLLDTVATSTEPATNSWEASYHTFVNNNTYSKYRLRITDRYGTSNYVCLNELKLVEAITDFTGLYRQDGILVSDSSVTGKKRRWLGIIYTYNNAGTVNFKDDVNYRFISNYYNRKVNGLQSSNSTTTWTYATSTWRESNGGTGQTRGVFVSCSSLNLSTIYSVVLIVGSSQASSIGIGVDSVTNTPSKVSQTNISSNPLISVSNDVFILSVGYHFITSMEWASGSNVTFYGLPQSCVSAFLLT
jgi:hypothetical protein